MADRKEYKKKYRVEHKSQINEYAHAYYESNKDKILAKKTIYRENNKEQIQEQVLCDVCGSSVSRPGMAKHKKTNKCVNHKLLQILPTK